MIQLREFSFAEDWEWFERCWVARGAVSAPPAKILPRLGRVAEIDGQPAAAGFMYLDAAGSGLCWIGWFIADPAFSPRRNCAALASVFESLEDIGRTLGAWAVFATVSDPVARFLQRSGYEPGDSGLNHMFKKI